MLFTGEINMRNNFKALIVHFIIIILSSIFLVIFVATGPKIGQYTTNIISRLFMGIALLSAYIFAGTFLDINVSRKYDFYAGCFIAVIGIGLWLYTFSIAGRSLTEIPKELSEYWILMNIYYMPYTFINFLFAIPNSPIISLITNLFPTLFMGFGLKLKRLKYNR